MNSWRDILPGRGECAFRRDQMRHVVHLAVDAERSSVGLGREGRNDTTRMRQIGLRRRKAGIDRSDLIGVDCDPSNKSVTSRDPAAFRQTILILEISIEGV